MAAGPTHVRAMLRTALALRRRAMGCPLAVGLEAHTTHFARSFGSTSTHFAKRGNAGDKSAQKPEYVDLGEFESEKPGPLTTAGLKRRMFVQYDDAMELGDPIQTPKEDGDNGASTSSRVFEAIDLDGLSPAEAEAKLKREAFQRSEEYRFNNVSSTGRILLQDDTWALQDHGLTFDDLGGVDEVVNANKRRRYTPPQPMPRGFHAIGEDPNNPSEALEDEPYEADDITSKGHNELELSRELRELYRVTAWDMPLLWSMQFVDEANPDHYKPYQPPTAQKPLRFRYTTYLGENHPASRKVVVDFRPSELPGLNKVQTDKIVKLLGVRYDPGKDRAKISCELFPMASQNKRWLGDTVDKLIAEAKNGEDTFEDVPFDFRHYKPKKHVKFPEAWLLRGARERQLKDAWVSQAQDTREVVDGYAKVRRLTAPNPATPERVPVPITQRYGQRKGRGRLAIAR